MFFLWRGGYVFKHFVCVHVHTCTYFDSDWWTICRINQEKGLTHTGGEIWKETSCLEILSLLPHLPSTLLKALRSQALSLSFLWKSSGGHPIRNGLGFVMGIGWGWVGRAEERPVLWVGEGIESGPLILKEQSLYGRGTLDNDRMGRKEKQARNKKSPEGGLTVNSWLFWSP